VDVASNSDVSPPAVTVEPAVLDAEEALLDAIAEEVASLVIDGWLAALDGALVTTALDELDPELSSVELHPASTSTAAAAAATSPVVRLMSCSPCRPLTRRSPG
jgi:hypothetical protein